MGSDIHAIPLLVTLSDISSTPVHTIQPTDVSPGLYQCLKSQSTQGHPLVQNPVSGHNYWTHFLSPMRRPTALGFDKGTPLYSAFGTLPRHHDTLPSVVLNPAALPSQWRWRHLTVDELLAAYFLHSSKLPVLRQFPIPELCDVLSHTIPTLPLLRYFQAT